MMDTLRFRQCEHSAAICPKLEIEIRQTVIASSATRQARKDDAEACHA